MRGVCAELTLCGGETYAKVSNIGLQIYCVTAAPRGHSGALLSRPRNDGVELE
jgi:hypothetical protein